MAEKTINEMNHTELKKYARELGLATVGTEEGLRKKIAKKLSEEPEPDEDDGLAERVNSECADMEDEEIVDLLKENGIEFRSALVDMVTKAVREGIIKLYDEVSVKKKKSLPTLLEYVDKIKEHNNIENKKMTPERKKSVKAAIGEAESRFEAEELTREDMISALDDYFGDDEKNFGRNSDKEIFEAYKHITLLFIDDDGEAHEKKDGYAVNKNPFCCARPLKKTKSELLKCIACGNKYENE